LAVPNFDGLGLSRIDRDRSPFGDNAVEFEIVGFAIVARWCDLDLDATILCL
jgi:hypothetical protein